MTGFFQRNPDRLVLLLAFYFALNILLRNLLPHGLELDEAQQVFFSQFLMAGYGTQPPFYNWLYYGVASVFGANIWTLALVKNLLLFSSYALYYAAARLLLRDRLLAGIAVLGLLLIPQVSFEAQRDLTHTVALIFSTSLFLYGMARTLTKADLPAYVIVGLAVGIGLISKYNFAVFLAAAFVALLLQPAGRARIFDLRLLVTAAIALAIISPHVFWLVNHLDDASGRTLDKMTAGAAHGRVQQILLGILSLAKAAAGFAGVTLVAFIWAGRGQIKAMIAADGPFVRLLRHLVGVAAALLIIVIIITHADTIKDRWLTPILLGVPLLMALTFEAAKLDSGLAFRRIFALALTVMIVVPLALNLRVTQAARIGQFEKLNVPYQAMVEAITAATGVTPGAVLTTEGHLAGNVRVNLPTAPVLATIYPDYDPDLAVSAARPLLLVWRDKGESHPAMPKELADWLAANPRFAGTEPEPQFVDLPYLYGTADARYGFGYAVVTPR